MTPTSAGTGEEEGTRQLNDSGYRSSLATTLVSLSESCTSIPHLKFVHALLIRSFHHPLSAAAACRVIAKLIRFAAVSPRGDLRYASLLLSFHRPYGRTNTPFFHNTLIRGYARSPDPHLAVSVFNSMRRLSLLPDPFSFTFLLLARSRCCSSPARPSCSGGDVHALGLKFGCLGPSQTHLHVHNALIRLYAGSSAVGAEHARRVFDEMPQRDVVSWSALLTAHLRSGQVEDARRVFEAMPDRDVVSWTAMISGYARARRPKQALELFRAMPMPPDEVTMVGVVSACTALGDLESGKSIYGYVRELGFNWMVSLCNALVDMFAKCGCLAKAREVFDETTNKSLVTWNTMLSAYAAHGNADSAIALFRQLEDSGMRPDGASYLAVLSSCAHEGQVDKGRRLFEAMLRSQHEAAGVEHYGCMVDMLGRAGLLKEAYNLIASMPIPGNDMVWGALLGACRIHGDVEMAESAVARLIELKPEEGGYYVLLSSIYAASGRQVEAADIRETMRRRGARKTPGLSSSFGDHYRQI